jgi:hypothetical protein
MTSTKEIIGQLIHELQGRHDDNKSYIADLEIPYPGSSQDYDFMIVSAQNELIESILPKLLEAYKSTKENP